MIRHRSNWTILMVKNKNDYTKYKVLIHIINDINRKVVEDEFELGLISYLLYLSMNVLLYIINFHF